MKSFRKNLLLFVLMSMAAILTITITPAKPPSNSTTYIKFETIVPSAFGEWRLVPDGAALMVDPQIKDQLAQLYSETLNRTYINSTGQRVMLSLAYGIQRDKESQVHRPDVCYLAQGFTIQNKEKKPLSTSYANIPTQRLVATLGNRIEPVTYWIRIGDYLADGWIGQKLAVVKQGLRGITADGLVFRMSTIAADPKLAYSLHERFAADLLNAIEPEKRRLFLGKSTPNIK